MRRYYDIVILGAGISGLVAAYRLSLAGKSVLVIEKDKEIGGALRSIKRPKYNIEEFYHHIIPSDRYTQDLIKELGLAKKLKFYPSTPAFIFIDRIFELGGAKDILGFYKLSIVERLRLGAFLAKILLIQDYKKYDEISAEKFFLDNVGRKVYNVFFKELLIGKFGEDYKNVSAAWFIARGKFRSNRKKGVEMLGYVENGFGSLITKLHKRCEEKGVEIITRNIVQSMTLKNKEIRNIIVRGKKVEMKHIISCIPTKQLGRLVKDKKINRLASLKTQGSITVLIGVKRKITSHYWSNVEIPNTKVRAVIEHTNLVPKVHYGEHLIYLASYPELKDSVWRKSDKQILKLYLGDLNKHTKLRQSDINWFHVSKLKEAGLVYTQGILNTLSKMDENKKSINNLHIIGMHVQFPERSIEHSIKQAEMVCKNILKQQHR